MPLLHRSFRRYITGATPLGLLLVATLGLAGWLGYQALDAAASQRPTAEAVLRDYAEISAWEFATIARRDLDDVLDDVFWPVRRMRSDGVPSPAAVGREMDEAARDQGCECPSLRSPLFLFRVDPPGGAVVAVPDTISDQTRGRVAELLTGWGRKVGGCCRAGSLRIREPGRADASRRKPAG